MNADERRRVRELVDQHRRQALKLGRDEVPGFCGGTTHLGEPCRWRARPSGFCRWHERQQVAA